MHFSSNQPFCNYQVLTVFLYDCRRKRLSFHDTSAIYSLSPVNLPRLTEIESFGNRHSLLSAHSSSLVFRFTSSSTSLASVSPIFLALMLCGYGSISLSSSIKIIRLLMLISNRVVFAASDSPRNRLSLIATLRATYTTAMIEIAKDTKEMTIAAILLLELRGSSAEVGGVFGDGSLGGVFETFGVGRSDL